MDIDNLTIAQARDIAAMFGSPHTKGMSEHRQSGGGRRVIVRSRDAGVLVGDLESYTATDAVLLNARQMWSWKAAQGGTLLDCATHGVKPSDCKFSAPNARVVVLGACAIVDVSDVAEKTMGGVKW